MSLALFGLHIQIVYNDVMGVASFATQDENLDSRKES
jgi:hypothetical protein